VTVTAPQSAEIPVISISTPDIVSVCSDFLVDLAASTGFGGRPFSPKFVVRTTAFASVAGLENILNKERLYNRPIRIPSGLLTTGSYIISVSACNFFSLCASSQKKISVVDKIIPMATIFGPSLRRHKVSDVLSLYASGEISDECGGNDSSLSACSFYSLLLFLIILLIDDNFDFSFLLL
jgi:hypothetical protein